MSKNKYNKKSSNKYDITNSSNKHNKRGKCDTYMGNVKKEPTYIPKKIKRSKSLPYSDHLIQKLNEHVKMLKQRSYDGHDFLRSLKDSQRKNPQFDEFWVKEIRKLNK